MTLLEEDLLASLKELLQASEVMSSGKNFPEDEMVRYKRAVEWATRVITLAESETN
jgi:roadblock/LC7 domain-containing protein